MAAPGLVLWGLIVGVGFALKSVRGFTRAEDSVNERLAAHRNTGLNTLTLVWSHIGNTGIITISVVTVAGLVWWRTREWRLSVFPAVAVFCEVSIFVPATNIVDRDRPPVAKLDPAPPTSSYPSGHVGASTALYVSLALLAVRLERRWLRRTTVACCLIVPFLVAFGRLYRGMHQITDVAVGMANGLLCGLFAYGWYRHRAPSRRAGQRRDSGTGNSTGA